MNDVDSNFGHCARKPSWVHAGAGTCSVSRAPLSSLCHRYSEIYCPFCVLIKVIRVGFKGDVP